jgi:translocator protein
MSKPYNNDWYQTLNKPSVVPPNWVFGVVWSVLYCMLAASLFVYVKAVEFQWTDGLLFFTVQMLCNLAWSILFFRLKMVMVACADCVIMIIFTALTIN